MGGGGIEHLNYRLLNERRLGMTMISVGVRNIDSEFSDLINRDRPIEFVFQYENKAEYSGVIFFNIKIKDQEGNYFLVTTSFVDGFEVKKGQNTAKMIVENNFFNEGNYIVDIMVMGKNNLEYTVFFHDADCLFVKILPEQREIGGWMGKEVGYVQPLFQWK